MQWIAAIVLMLVISIALTALGFFIAWRMDSTQGFHAIMSVFLLPMWLLSGAFFPMDVGGWLGWIVRLNPLTYGVAGLRHYLQNDSITADLPSLAICWLVSLAFAARHIRRRLVDRRHALDRRLAMNQDPQPNPPQTPSAHDTAPGRAGSAVPYVLCFAVLIGMTLRRLEVVAGAPIRAGKG